MLPTRRQKAVLEAIQDHMSETGQMPTLSEIAKRCGLSSVATVHRHVALLQERGLLRRRRSRRRGIELRPAARSSAALGVPILGRFSPGRPIEPLSSGDEAAVPRDMISKPSETFALVVSGESLSSEQILDGDVMVLERRDRAAEGDMVVALQGNGDAFLTVARREKGRLLFQASPAPGPRPGEDDERRLHGVVVGLLRRFE
jgi:repressor LexA